MTLKEPVAVPVNTEPVASCENCCKNSVCGPKGLIEFNLGAENFNNHKNHPRPEFYVALAGICHEWQWDTEDET